VFGQFVNVVLCDTCNGEGQIAAAPCKECHGQGRRERNKRITVKIPAGIDHGQQIRLVGEGETGPKGGPAGDLYVVIDVEESPTFTRQGSDIYYELPLNVAQAALGDKVTVPTLDGETELKIPAGTQFGQSFRLRGMGVPHLRAPGRGDMYVAARVTTPTHLSSRQRELFEQLAKEMEGEDKDGGFFEKVKEAFGG
jgi:molecular chaperone DnaJ